MFKLLLLPILAAATMSAAAVPAAHAMSGVNGTTLNGVARNGSDPTSDAAFHAVRLTLPDGTPLTFH
jgi:hypothetical protein